GRGRCVLTIDPGPGRSAYQSVVPLEGLTTSDVLERYMARSEQLETRFCLAADPRRAAGILIQRLPEEGGRARGDDDRDLWERVSRLLRTMTPGELLELPGTEILRRLFHQENLRRFDSASIRFACRCSRARVGGVIRM